MLQVFWQAQTRRVRAGGRAYGPPVLMPVLYAVSFLLSFRLWPIAVSLILSL